MLVAGEMGSTLICTHLCQCLWGHHLGSEEGGREGGGGEGGREGGGGGGRKGGRREGGRLEHSIPVYSRLRTIKFLMERWNTVEMVREHTTQSTISTRRSSQHSLTCVVVVAVLAMFEEVLTCLGDLHDGKERSTFVTSITKRKTSSR